MKTPSKAYVVGAKVHKGFAFVFRNIGRGAVAVGTTVRDVAVGVAKGDNSDSATITRRVAKSRR
jgi:hypothetical protein